MNSQIVKKTQELTKAEDMRNHTKLVMQPYANWETYLTPAPLSIALLGELVFISSKTDFSINKNPPKDGYKFIRYPNSFQACLMQVCDSGWWAFNEAHTNMDKIRLHTLNVPDCMKEAVKILFQGDDEVVNASLPDSLENIRTIAHDCCDLAKKTEKRFTDVINIIQELLEACTNAKSFYGEEVEEIKKKLNENKMRKEAAEKAAEDSEKMLQSMKEELQEARESYSAAMNSIPSGWEMMAMDFVGALSDCTTCLMNGYCMQSMYRMSQNLMSKGKTAGSDATNQNKEEDDYVNCMDKVRVYSKSVEILKSSEIILDFVQEDEINWTELYDQKNKAARTDFSAQQFKRIRTSLDKLPSCEPNRQAKTLCDDGITICEELSKYAPDIKCEPAVTKGLIKQIQNLVDSARKFDSTSKNVTKCPSMTPKPPMMFKEENNSGRGIYSQMESDKARFKVEQSRAQLQQTREDYNKTMDSMKKDQKELTEILISMRNCEVKEIDFNTTIKMLVKGMDAMGRVEEQWKKMVRFFQMVSNIVEISLSKTLKDFVSTSEKTKNLSYNGKLFCKDLLYNQAFQASNIASLVHMISSTYTEVSEKYLMDRVSSLQKLMVMVQSKPEFLEEQQQLRDKCDEAGRAILQLVQKNREEFERKTAERLEKIDKELLAILAAAAPEKIQRIKAAAEEGFKEEDGAADYY